MIDALNALVAKHPAIDFWQAHHRLRLAGLHSGIAVPNVPERGELTAVSLSSF